MTDLAPEPSPVRPTKPRVGRLFSEVQLAEALKLARTDGVVYASKMTGVSAASIYNALKNKKRSTVHRTSRIVRPEVEMTQNPLFRKALTLGAIWAANSAPAPERKAYERAGAHLGLSPAMFWRAVKHWRYANKK